MKDLLQKTKPGDFFFGEKLSEKIKTVKSIEKVGKEIKNAPPASSAALPNRFNRPSRNATTSRSLNWKSPYANRGNSHMCQKSQYQKYSRPISLNNRPAYSNTPSQTRTNQSTHLERRK